ncbi:hypothetical protein HU200_047671 [Digitaria exilis]|uniref:Uncharacterized protein n=1 Tax=Digitaria exilis TaxID=1010633 RepID=A0A835ECS4_9POAL|nr:hypothetical protein HU200_047671 [Digitaria exilis]
MEEACMPDRQFASAILAIGTLGTGGQLAYRTQQTTCDSKGTGVISLALALAAFRKAASASPLILSIYRLLSPHLPKPINRNPHEPAAMAMAVRAFYLSVVVLALVPFLAQATAAENLLVRSCSLTTTTLPPHCSEFPLGVDAPPTAASARTTAFIDHLHAPSPSGALADATAPHSLGVSAGARQHQDGTAAAQAAPVVVSGSEHNLVGESVSFERCAFRPPSTTTTHSDDSSPRNLGASATARQIWDNTASPEAAAARPAPRSPRGLDLHTSATIVEAAQRRGVTVSATTPATKAVLLRALPILAIPFLPRPVAALVVFSFLATPVRAWSGCSRLSHATCDLYKYDNETGTVDRRRPDPTVHAKCEHPLCHDDTYKRAVIHAQEHGRGDDPLLIYCSFHVLKRPPSILPWLNEDVTHMPIANPAAVAASGDRVCYVELTHMGYREGYYIRCPSPYSEGRGLACMEFPEEEIVAAVWEHRRLNYRDTVWPQHLTPTLTPTEKHDDL